MPAPPEKGALARWAIQIATVNSLKWRGHKRLGEFLGNHAIEHSYTRMAQIWCDQHGNPLKNPKTGKLYEAINVRGILNPLAVDLSTGEIDIGVTPRAAARALFPAMFHLSEAFRRGLGLELKESPAKRISIFSFYEDYMRFLEPYHVLETPAVIGDQDLVEAMWTLYQDRAMEINSACYAYDLKSRNCHTVNAVLNRENTEAVRRFASRGMLTWGVDPEAIQVLQAQGPVIRDLAAIQSLNRQKALMVDECSGYGIASNSIPAPTLSA